MTDYGFALWESAGITTLKDLFEGDRMMSFVQLRLIYNLSHTHFLRFLQIKSFIQNPIRHKFTLEMSPIEQLLYKVHSNKAIVRRCYEAFYKYIRLIIQLFKHGLRTLGG